MRSERPVETEGASIARDPFSAHEAMLSWVRDIAPYGLFTTDRNLVIRDWNEWLATHSGLAAEKVVGRPLLEVFPDIAERRVHEHFTRALRGDVAMLSTALHKYLLPFPNPVREYDARFMLQTARIAPLPDQDRIIGTITIIEDVTQRECQAMILRRQQEYDRLLSDALAELLHTNEPLRTITDLFPRMAVPLKLDVYLNYVYTPDSGELRLQGAGGITPEARRALATLPVAGSICGAAALSRRGRVEPNLQQNTSPLVAHTRKIGLHSYAAFPLLIGERVLGTLSFGSYTRDAMSDDEIEFLGKLTQYVAIALDRSRRETDLREAQARLSAHATELETKIAERTARLQETIAQLESFSYTIAHDLRAPIRSLTTFADILLTEFGAVVPENALDLLRRLQRSSLRLDALTRDLLRFSRIVREEVQLTDVDLDELIEGILSDTPALQGDVVTLVHPLGTVVAQRTLLQQCLCNLLDNALKFTAPGIEPRITLRTELRAAPTPPRSVAGLLPLIPATIGPPRPPSGPVVRLWVEDNGIGIPTEAHDKIWGIFERLPTATKVEGTGIGLAIVARAMQQMGGGCGLESQSGHGTRFWLEFPSAVRDGRATLSR